jgi:nicotinamidase-related amidase
MNCSHLRLGPLSANSFHLCVDMQRMFAEKTDWHLPWMAKVRPYVHRIAAHHPNRTIFTRFIPVQSPGMGTGLWRAYYERWSAMTIDRLGAEMLELVPELASLVPPAKVVDKMRYSPWFGTDLPIMLRDLGADTLIVSGGETDVCVISTVLGAVDRGYRVIIVTDALCSSSDAAHDAAIRIYSQRFNEQIETVKTEDLLREW